jgi:hypothetical protein
MALGSRNFAMPLSSALSCEAHRRSPSRRLMRCSALNASADDDADERATGMAFPHPQAGSMAARPFAGYRSHCRSYRPPAVFWVGRRFPLQGRHTYGSVAFTRRPFFFAHGLSGDGLANASATAVGQVDGFKL